MPRYLNGSLMNRWAQITLIAGLGLSALAAWQLDASNDSRIEAAVGKAAEQAIKQVRNRIATYEYGLSGARGAVLSFGEHGITRKLFERYSLARDIDQEFPGARGFGFIRRVPQADERKFLERAKANGWPDFSITELHPHDRERFVIQYIEPLDRNIEAIGLDIGSEANRRSTAEKAIRTGKPRLTGPITLVQATGSPQQSFLILMPIYRNGSTPDTVAERSAQAYGWSYAPLLMKEVLADVRLDTRAIHLELWDVTTPGKAKAFYTSDPAEGLLRPPRSTQFELYGRQWESRLGIRPPFIERLHLPSPLQLFLLGSLISVLAAALVGMGSLERNNRRRIHDNQARLAAIVESSEDGIISQRLDGNITSWNRGAEHIFGYSAQEAIGQTVTDLLVPEGYQQEEADIRARVLSGEAVSLFETIRRCKSGGCINTALTISPIHDSTGRVIGTSKTVRDITRQKVTEARILELNSSLEAQVSRRTAELTAARDQLTMAAEVAEMGVWSWNLADDSLSWNDRMFELYEQPKALRDQGLNYKHWCSRIHADDAASTEHSMQAALAGQGHFEPTFRIVLANGQIRFIHARAHVVRDQQGQAVKVTGINLDITAQRELETRLRWSKQQADEASNAKSNFLANMSHEIRTPMNAVLGMLQLVRKTELNERQHDYIAKAQIAGGSLLNLLNDILDYSKIEANKLWLEPHAFELDAMLRDLAIVLAGNTGDKPIELMFDLDPALPNAIVGDRLRLQQVLINLAGNAIKFTEQGEIVVQLRVAQRTSTRLRLCFAVTDTGIGIASHKLEHIFDVFAQAEASTARRFGGTGLGLVISRRLVRLMGGDLQVSSVPGVGSRFWFEIEVDLAAPSATEPGIADTEARILVVDDNELSARILTRTLSGLGYRVAQVTSGREALTEIETRGDYDLILLDWRMSDLDGLATAERIRALPRLHHQPAIIMVTAFGRDELTEAQRQTNPPFNDFLTKPLTTKQLTEAIHKALHKIRFDPERLVPAKSSSRRLDGLRVLVVEDNAFNRQVAAELLMSEGSEVALATGGLEGVQKVAEAPGSFDLVLMDMQMPDIDGLEATRRIRQHPEGHRIPILAMTANVTAADQAACLAAGMDAHLGKPIDLDTLVALILTLLEKRPDVPALASSEKPASDIEPLDLILRRFGGDLPLYRTLLKSLKDNGMREFAALQSRLADQDAPGAAANLHTLKGMTSTMGMTGLAAQIANLEKRVKQEDISHSILLDEDELDALIQRFLRHHTSLETLASSSKQGNADKPANLQQQPVPELRMRLEALLDLLDTGNLKAVDVMEELMEFRPSEDTSMEELTAEVQRLNFSTAGRIVRELLEEI